MYDIYLIRGRGIETMLGIPSYEIENALSSPKDFSNCHEELSIPPFESEELKSVKEERNPYGKLISPFGKREAFLAIGFISFEFIVFLLCALLPR